MTESNKGLKEKTLSHVLGPVRTLLLREVLDEWSSKLRIDGAAQVIASNVEVAETIAQWIEDSHRDHPYSIKVLEDQAEKDVDPKLQKLATISLVQKIPDDTITHAFSHINIYDRHDALWVFKKIFYSLIPKGIAIVTCFRQNPINDILDEVLTEQAGKRNEEPRLEGTEHVADTAKDGDLADLAEEAQFERGKIRSYQKHIAINGEVLNRLSSVLQTSLQESLGPCEPGCGWRSALHDALKRRTEHGGALTVEAELILAMRWDLLCA